MPFGGMYESISKPAPYIPPEYNPDSDYSLVKLNASVKELKKIMIEHVTHLKNVYKRSKDKNTKLMYKFGITVVVPLAYYFYKGVISSNLPYNRSKQCSKMIKIIQALGTDERDGATYIHDKISELFSTLKRGNSKKLLPVLLAIYGTSVKFGGFRIEAIENYKKRLGAFVNYDIEQYLNENLLQQLKSVDILPEELEEMVLEYSEYKL